MKFLERDLRLEEDDGDVIAYVIRGTQSSVKERRERPGGLGWAASLRARVREKNGLGPAGEGRLGLAGLFLFF